MKNIYDYKHVKSVAAISLVFNGKQAGKIIANWSDNPNGSVCTACVMIWDGPLRIERTEKVELMGKIEEITTNSCTKKAGGYGYCKFSQAVGEAINQTQLNGRGEGAVRKFFEDNGYRWDSVI